MALYISISGVPTTTVSRLVANDGGLDDSRNFL